MPVPGASNPAPWPAGFQGVLFSVTDEWPEVPAPGPLSRVRYARLTDREPFERATLEPCYCFWLLYCYRATRGKKKIDKSETYPDRRTKITLEIQR